MPAIIHNGIKDTGLNAVPINAEIVSRMLKFNAKYQATGENRCIAIPSSTRADPMNRRRTVEPKPITAIIIPYINIL